MTMDARSSPFSVCCHFVIGMEGGDRITNNSKDPGGLTRWGISQRAFPLHDIITLTRDEAEALYETHYWDKAKCADLPLPLAAIHFDAAVNQGLNAAALMLQSTLMVKPDGDIGPVTLAAAKRGNVRSYVTEYAARRMHRYALTGNFDAFGLGWSRRLMACVAFALQLAEPV